MTARARVVAVTVAVVTVTALAAPARADSVSDKQREAQQIANRIEQLGSRAADLGEALNGAQLQLDEANADVKTSEAKLGSLQAKLASMRGALGDFAVRAYVYADQTTGLAGLLSGSSLTDGAAQRTGYQSVALGANLDVTDDVKAVVEDTQRQQDQLDAQRQKASQLADNYTAAKKQAEQALGQQQQLQVKVSGELAVLVSQERQRRAAAAAAAAAAAVQRAAQPTINAAPVNRPAPTQNLVAPKAPAPPPQIDIPATSPGAATAVRAALSQVGKSYRFAAAGPDAYDCSGLTMWAWAQAGISLPHYSKAQWESLNHVPMNALQPGDLIFFYRDVSHVGIYIGGGQMVDAASPALGVRVTGIGGSVIGAARP
jgi:cell wall-associated NlpC family hydrolase